MARLSLLALAAATALSISGVNAGLCRPSTTSSTISESTPTHSPSSSPTTSTTPESTPGLTPSSSFTSSTTPESTPGSSSSTTLESTPVFTPSSSTTPENTPTLTPVSPSTTPVYTPTSTTSEEGGFCTPRTVNINPSFDYNNGAPWAFANGATWASDGTSRSGSHNVRLQFTNGDGNEATFSQTIHNIESQQYSIAYWFTVVSSTAVLDTDGGFSCSIVLSIGGHILQEGEVDNLGPFFPTFYGSAVSWYNQDNSITQAKFKIAVTCNGDFSRVILSMDDVSFTRECSNSK
ncbi:hypothetical protein EDB80DRAFT_715022 [Ilyonectria destructans]|nr:hypothetical protein EDB80DRAFT_715022 [Ilyonectria destructans]